MAIMSFRPGWRVGVLGALIAQPLFFILAFLWGVAFGAGDMMSTAGSHYTYGLEGGEKAVGNMSFVYLISFGTAAFVVSVVGAVLAVVFAFAVHWLR